MTIQCQTIVAWDGKRECVGSATYTGNSGTPGTLDGSASDTTDVQKKKEGQCSGTINGQTVYYTCATTEQKTSTTGTKDATGATTSTTTTSTSCNGAQCTTTATTTDASGNTTGTITRSESQASFCTENPTFAACKSSVFSATACGTVPSCEGDPIQCAMVKKQHETACAFTNADQSLIDAGNAAANGEAQPDGHPGAAPNTSQFAFSSLIDTGSGGISGGCPQDVTVGPVTLPFSKLCSALQIMGAIAVGFSMIAAMGIVFRS